MIIGLASCSWRGYCEGVDGVDGADDEEGVLIASRRGMPVVPGERV